MAEFILKIKKGKTNCNDCPFCGGYTYLGDVKEGICNMPLAMDVDCDKYDMNTMQVSKKIIKTKNK